MKIVAALAALVVSASMSSAFAAPIFPTTPTMTFPQIDFEKGLKAFEDCVKLYGFEKCIGGPIPTRGPKSIPGWTDPAPIFSPVATRSYAMMSKGAGWWEWYWKCLEEHHGNEAACIRQP